MLRSQSPQNTASMYGRVLKLPHQIKVMEKNVIFTQYDG